METSRRVLTFGLIDNHAIMRKGLSIIFERDYGRIGVVEADNIYQFIQKEAVNKVDVILFSDNFVNVNDCLDVVSELKFRYPNIPLILYGELPEYDMTIPYFKMGVNGYVLKSDEAHELIRCVNNVLGSRRYLCPELLDRMMADFMENLSRSSIEARLTVRESEIASYLSEGRRNSWIAKKLGCTASTISSMKTRILQKMEVGSVVELRGALYRRLY
jgi:DNA-binding NarL/FixJ family response regulator